MGNEKKRNVRRNVPYEWWWEETLWRAFPTLGGVCLDPALPVVNISLARVCAHEPIPPLPILNHELADLNFELRGGEAPGGTLSAIDKEGILEKFQT